jgi:hypothetical protein
MEACQGNAAEEPNHTIDPPKPTAECQDEREHTRRKPPVAARDLEVEIYCPSC